VSSGSWKFRENHLTRVLKAAKKAGYCVNKASINAAGEIVLMFDQHDETDTDTPNPWDKVYAANQKRSA
jgi:hypothetical protein